MINCSNCLLATTSSGGQRANKQMEPQNRERRREVETKMKGWTKCMEAANSGEKVVVRRSKGYPLVAKLASRIGRRSRVFFSTWQASNKKLASITIICFLFVAPMKQEASKSTKEVAGFHWDDQLLQLRPELNEHIGRERGSQFLSDHSSSGHANKQQQQPVIGMHQFALSPISNAQEADLKRPLQPQPQQHPRGRRAQLGGNGNQAPKLVQWAKEAVQYYEGSTLVLSCSLAMSLGPQGGALKFAWFKQGKILQQVSGSRLSIETLPDYSFLRLADLRASDSGPYTCAASNSYGQEDRTTTQVIVNVKLKWLAPSQGDERNNRTTSTPNFGHQMETVKAGQSVIFECGAAGQPRPKIRWFRLATTLRQRGELLMARPQFKLDEAQIRTFLLQWDSSPPPIGLSDSMQRLEIGDGQQQQLQTSSMRIDSHANETSRWRVETSVGATQHEIYSRLVLDRAEPSSSGLYECESVVETATSSSEQQQLAADRLRRLFGLSVNGK